jgi:hypothetical protein
MGKRLSAREERVMTDKDTFEFEVETLTGDGVGLEPSTRKHPSSKDNDHGLDDLEHSLKKARKLQ